jgi:hypothetical protein
MWERASIIFQQCLVVIAAVNPVLIDSAPRRAQQGPSKPYRTSTAASPVQVLPSESPSFSTHHIPTPFAETDHLDLNTLFPELQTFQPVSFRDFVRRHGLCLPCGEASRIRSAIEGRIMAGISITGGVTLFRHRTFHQYLNEIPAAPYEKLLIVEQATLLTEWLNWIAIALNALRRRMRPHDPRRTTNYEHARENVRGSSL